MVILFPAPFQGARVILGLSGGFAALHHRLISNCASSAYDPTQIDNYYIARQEEHLQRTNIFLNRVTLTTMKNIYGDIVSGALSGRARNFGSIRWFRCASPPANFQLRLQRI